jgi:hypothetical protein
VQPLHPYLAMEMQRYGGPTAGRGRGSNRRPERALSRRLASRAGGVRRSAGWFLVHVGLRLAAPRPAPATRLAPR